MADSLSSLGAVASGIDYRSLVDQVIKLDRRTADRMQATVDANGKRKDALNQFQQALAALKTAADALRDGTPFGAFTTSVQGTASTGRALVAAVAGAGAAPGSYTLEVRALASTQKTVGTQGFGADPLGLAGTFTVTGNGVTEPVALDGTETLAGVRDKLNALTARTGVQATIVSGGAADQRLVLTSTRSGEAGRFTLADAPADPAADPSAPSLVDALGVRAATVPGGDAELVIDGAVTVRRATNTVADAIPGVTLTLVGAEPGTRVTLGVERQQSAATDAAKAFADAYNKVQAFLKTQTGKGGVLATDGFVRGVRGELSRTLVSGGAATLPAGLASLGAVGFSLGKDGTLAFDAAKFEAAGARLDDLRAVLTDRMDAFSRYLDPIAQTGGTLDTREANLDAASGALAKRIEDVDSRLDKKRAALLAQWSRFESTLGRLNAIGSQIGAQLTGLTASKDS